MTGFKSGGAKAFTEAEAQKTGVFFDDGHTVMSSFLKGV
jgi:hypothetical protein